MTILTWIGNLFIVLGLWHIGNKKRFAFLLSLVGEGLWIVASLYAHLWSLAFICAVFFGMALRNWFKWSEV